MKKKFQKKIEVHKSLNRNIIYLDESGFAADSTREQGYSLKGERCNGVDNRTKKGRINVIRVIINFVFVTLCTFVGNINSDLFYAWLVNNLLPKVSKGAVIVMDNAAFHKRKDIIEAIKSHGCFIEYLPPYSPELNPIEKNGHKQKLYVVN